MFPDDIFFSQEELSDWTREGRLHWQQRRLATESPGGEQVSGGSDDNMVRFNIHILSSWRPPMLLILLITFINNSISGRRGRAPGADPGLSGHNQHRSHSQGDWGLVNNNRGGQWRTLV